jgi:DNA-binding winged helix-turn-helix (wHTH) protein
LRIAFGDVTLDPLSRQLFRRSDEIHLSPKAFDLLTLLIDDRPRAISKKELLERLWPSTYVSETSLATLVREIRAALGDDAGRPMWVRTVHRFGYAFCGAVAGSPGAPAPAGTRLGCWLIWDARHMPLQDGENILGRDQDATARVDSATVSRRHARILIGVREATIDDLGSKNGTYVRGARISAPAQLLDGDQIQLGSTTVTFRMASRGGSTATDG